MVKMEVLNEKGRKKLQEEEEQQQGGIRGAISRVGNRIRSLFGR